MTSLPRVLRVLALVVAVAVVSHPAEAGSGGGGHGGGGHGGGHGAGGPHPPGGGGPHGGWGGPHGGWGGGGHYYGHGPTVVFGTGFGFYDPFFYPYPFYPYRYGYPYTYPAYPYPYVYMPPYDTAPPPDTSAPSGAAPPSDSAPPSADNQGGAPDADVSTYGLVQLRDVPDGAAVELDGRFWLEAHGLGERWLAVPSGAHTIVVRAQGFASAERHLDVAAGERLVIRFGRLRAEGADAR